MASPSWDLKYLESIEARLRRIEHRLEELETAVDARVKVRKSSSKKDPDGRLRQSRLK